MPSRYENEPASYPDLPKPPPAKGTAAANPAPALDAGTKAVTPADRRPAIAPQKVTHGPNLPGVNISGMSGLPNAAVQAAAKGPAASGRVVAPKSPLSAAAAARAVPSNKPGFDLIRSHTTVPAPVRADEGAEGRFGGLARWDDLRERLRREPYRLPVDDPLFAVVGAMEEMEVSLKTVVKRQREETSELVRLLRATLESVDPTRDLLEQSVNQQGDLMRLFEPLSRRFEEEVKLLREQRETSSPPVASSTEALPAAPASAIAPEVKREPWWWFLRKLWQP